MGTVAKRKRILPLPSRESNFGSPVCSIVTIEFGTPGPNADSAPVLFTFIPCYLSKCQVDSVTVVLSLCPFHFG
jgi:hypothetical protein